MDNPAAQGKEYGVTVNTGGGGNGYGGGVPLLTPETHWKCDARGCGQVAVTREVGDHTRYHVCRGRDGTAGMTVPMTRAGVRCDVRAVERQDYIGRDDVQLNADGRPVMAVTIEREDGQDAAAYLPCATAKVGDFR